MALRTIGVGYDGGPESQEALRAGLQLAARTGAAIVVLSVIEPVPVLLAPYAPAAYPSGEAAACKHARRSSTRRSRRCRPLSTDGAILSGPVAPTLAQAAQDRDLDLLVVGSRAFGPVRRVLLGSVAARLITMSPAPLLVVPRTA